MTSDEVKALDVGRALSPRDRAGNLGLTMDADFNRGVIVLTSCMGPKPLRLVLTSEEQVDDFLDLAEDLVQAAREGALDR